MNMYDWVKPREQSADDNIWVNTIAFLNHVP